MFSMKKKSIFTLLLSLAFIFGTIPINAADLSTSSLTQHHCFDDLHNCSSNVHSYNLDDSDTIHFNDLDDSIKNSIIEFIEENNATIALPFVTQYSIIETNDNYIHDHSYFEDTYIPITPNNWPWNDCSNILGHDWYVVPGSLISQSISHSSNCHIPSMIVNCYVYSLVVFECNRTYCRSTEQRVLVTTINCKA